VKKQVILTGHQLKELQFFCKNVTGVRQEYYEMLDEFLRFKPKIDELMKTAKMISKYLKELGEDHDISPFKNWFDLESETGSQPVEK
jgi:hypothetical protein